MELPPRARRILSYDSPRCLYIGTTSACAENTANSRPARSPAWNYLRVRGEYLIENHGIGPSLELPPRARRILQGGVTWATGHGTTSACAENTSGWGDMGDRSWNYLRVRGEYGNFLDWGYVTAELPPRARRIPMIYCLCKSEVGTTSACAENTTIPHAASSASWNYLRVRGEY